MFNEPPKPPDIPFPWDPDDGDNDDE